MTVCGDQAQLICTFLNLTEDTVEIVFTFILGNGKESLLYHLFAQGTTQRKKSVSIRLGKIRKFVGREAHNIELGFAAFYLYPAIIFGIKTDFVIRKFLDNFKELLC